MVEILSHAAEVKIVSSNGIDVLAHERRRMAYRLVVEPVPFKLVIRVYTISSPI